MFTRNQVPAFQATRAAFGQRKIVMPAAAKDVPAHVAAEWTGRDERPQGASARIAALLA